MKFSQRLTKCILFNIFSLILIQSLLFLCGQGISILGLVLSPILWLLYSYLYIDDKTIKKDSLIVFIAFVAIIMILNVYFSYFLETSYDGNFYHGNAMVKILQGWNPYYETNVYNTSDVNIWADLYPKASWIFGAVVIKYFNNLSAPMIMNTLIAIATMLYSFYSVKLRNKPTVLAVIVSIIILLNPIVIEQMHSYYIDGMLGNLSILLVLFIMNLTITKNNRDFLFIVVISVLMITIKISGFGFAGLINLGGFLYFILKKDKSWIIYYSVAGFSMIFISVCIIGYSPYLVNILSNRNILYPILGEGSADVISFVVPDEILEFSPLSRIKYSLLSGMSIKDSLMYFGKVTYLMVDERIGAFGPYFSKIVLISGLVIVASTIDKIRKKEIDLMIILLFIGVMASILVNFSNIWWFRYIPHAWMFVAWAAYLSFDTKKFKAVSMIILLFVLYQNVGIYLNTVENDYTRGLEAKGMYEKYAGKSIYCAINAHTPYDETRFDVYEEFRSMFFGIEYVDIDHNYVYEELTECYKMGFHDVCVLESWGGK